MVSILHKMLYEMHNISLTNVAWVLQKIWHGAAFYDGGAAFYGGHEAMCLVMGFKTAAKRQFLSTRKM